MRKTAYELRISDWSSDVCSSDLDRRQRLYGGRARAGDFRAHIQRAGGNDGRYARPFGQHHGECGGCFGRWPARNGEDGAAGRARRATRPGPGGGLSMGYWLAKTEHQMKRGWIKRFDPRFWAVNFPRPMKIGRAHA